MKEYTICYTVIHLHYELYYEGYLSFFFLRVFRTSETAFIVRKILHRNTWEIPIPTDHAAEVDSRLAIL